MASLAEDDFVVGDANRLAFGHVRAFPEWPGPWTLIVGPPKSGKSHLARIFAARSGAIFAGPEMVEALAREGGSAPLVIEDADRAGYSEDSLFHLLNQSMRAGRPLLITARDPVAAWPFKTDDLRSRARLGAQFTVAAADDTLLSQMFVKLFADRQVIVEPRVISYMVTRMERAPEEVVALAELADRLALARGTAITRGIAAEALAERGVAQLELDFGDADDE